MAQTQEKQDGRRSDREKGDGIIDKLVDIRRVSKTVKGGRTMRFAALVVAGDTKGRAGFGTGKAKEVPEAIRKASEVAKRNLKRVPLRGGKTLHHDVKGRYGASKVVFRAAQPGTGIIAGGPIRAVFEVLGIQDVVSKSVGSSNPNNMVRATFDAFASFESPRHVAQRRTKNVSDILGKKKQDHDEVETHEEVSVNPEVSAEESKA